MTPGPKSESPVSQSEKLVKMIHSSLVVLCYILPPSDLAPSRSNLWLQWAHFDNLLITTSSAQASKLCSRKEYLLLCSRLYFLQMTKLLTQCIPDAAVLAWITNVPMVYFWCPDTPVILVRPGKPGLLRPMISATSSLISWTQPFTYAPTHLLEAQIWSCQ